MINNVRKNFLEMSKILSKNDGHVMHKVTSCLDNCSEYFKTSNLEERGFEECPAEDIACWLALVDLLIEQEFAFEVDWKQEPSEVLHKFRRLSKNIPTEINDEIFEFDEKSMGKLSVEEVCRLIQNKLNTTNYTVAQMDIDSDSYVLTLLKENVYPTVRDLAKNVGKIIRTQIQ